MPTLTAEYTRPWMAEYQTAAVFNDARYAVVEASTKSGKTVACLVWLLEQAMQGASGKNYWWVAPVYSQAAIAFERMKFGIPRGLYAANETDLAITLANGAVLWFKSGEKPDNLYGEDVYAAVIDEASRVREEAWVAVRTTLTATRGPVRVIGNVKGRRNWAYKLARGAQDGRPGMHYAKITAYDAIQAGVLDAAEVEDARTNANLPADVFKQLYEAEPSDDEGNPFGYQAIRGCIGPLSTASPFTWGWDLARSNDWTVGIALDAAGKVCQLHRWNQSSMPQNRAVAALDGSGASSHPEYWAVTLNRVRSLTGHVPAYVDSTGPGGPIDQALAADGLANIEGYVFTSRSKQLLMEGLAVAIQQKQITYPEGVISQELEAFEYTYTRTGVRYEAPEGLHDDAVCALALARAKYEQRTAGQFTARGLADMIRGGQVVKVIPDGAPTHVPTAADWVRGLKG